MYRTLLDKVRCMLVSSSLPTVFWGEAVMTAAHLVNLSPSTAIDFKSPDFVWYEKLPDYSRLRVFGCTAYAHQTEGKLEPRSTKCVFLGYPNGVKRYRLWLKDSGYKVIISRDVIFNEHAMPCRETSSAGSDEVTEKRTNEVQIEGESENEGENDDDHEPYFVREPDKGQETPIQSEDEESDVDQPQPESKNNRTITASLGYLLTRDRTRRIRRSNPKYSYADIIAY